MIDLDELHTYLSSLDIGMPIYLNLFPDELQYSGNAENITNTVAFSLKTVESNPVIERTNMRFLIRGEHPDNCVKAGTKIIKQLDYRTNVIVGDTQIILFKAVDRTPEALGIDENKNNIYKVDVLITASPL